MTNELQNNQDTNKETRTLVERLKARSAVLDKDSCLVLDISSSMNIAIEPEKRRIDALRDIVKALSVRPPTIVFSDQARLLASNEDIPNPSGGTYMERAFSLAKQNGYKNLLLITDGEASKENFALEAAQSLNVQIMYVGSGNYPQFLEDLAAQSGSFCTIEDLTKPKELGEKIRLLLSAGDGEINKGPICL